MRLPMLVLAGILLVALLPGSDSRSLSRAPNAATVGLASPPSSQLQFQPFLLRMGEEYFVRLGNLNKYLSASFLSSRLPDTFQELQLAGQGRADAVDGELSPYSAQEDPTEKGKRSEDPPISLDLTFHLLREVLEMARAEQIAHQAHSNRKLMDTAGK